MGKFIVIEGLDGSGKGTQTTLLTDYFKKTNKPFRKLNFPDYENESSTLVKMYLRGEFGNKAGDVNPYAASTFYAADRYASYIRYWKDDYKGDKIIVADRYTTSNAVHQTCKMSKDNWDAFLLWLYDFEFEKIGIPKPDLVLYFDMKPEISQRLMSNRYSGDESKKDIHESDIQYLNSCREAALYAANFLSFKIIKCYEGDQPLSVEEIFEKVKEQVEKII